MTLLNLIGIQDALADTTHALAGAPVLTAFLPWMVLIGALFYFMIFRPQSKQAKDQKQMLSDIQKGDEVLTAGGIVGKVAKMADDFVVISIGDNVEFNLKKTSIAKVLPKGTLKAI